MNVRPRGYSTLLDSILHLLPGMSRLSMQIETKASAGGRPPTAPWTIEPICSYATRLRYAFWPLSQLSIAGATAIQQALLPASPMLRFCDVIHLHSSPYTSWHRPQQPRPCHRTCTSGSRGSREMSTRRKHFLAGYCPSRHPPLSLKALGLISIPM